MCRVSIILPTYNRKKRIARAIESVLRQEIQDFELIIVDDASDDGTEQYIHSLPEQHIRYIRLPQNAGAAAARNAGIQIAHGEYIAFQDSDTEWVTDKLEKQLRYMDFSGGDVAMVYSPYKIIYPEYALIYPGFDVPLEEKCGHILRSLLEHPLIGTPTMLIRKRILDELGGFDPGMRALEDYELSIRIAERYQIGMVDEVLLISYNGRDSISNNVEQYIDMSFYLLQKHRKLFERYDMTMTYLDQVSRYALRYQALDYYVQCLQKVFWDGEKSDI